MNIILVDDLFKAVAYYKKIGFLFHQFKMIYPQSSIIFTLKQESFKYEEPKDVFATIYTENLLDIKKKLENNILITQITEKFLICIDDYGKMWKFEEREYFHWKKVMDIDVGYAHGSVVYKKMIYSIYGAGLFDHFFDYIFQYDIKSNKMNLSSQKFPQQAPSKRNYPSCEIFGNQVYLFGGYDINRSFKDDLWILNMNTFEWKFINVNERPPCRRYHSSTTLGNQMFIFGGETAIDVHINDLWVLNVKTLKWKRLESNLTPPARRYASLVTIDSNLLLFGGRNDDFRMNDLWEYDTIKNSWRIIEALGDIPKKRSGHSAVAYKSSMYIIGGNNGDNPLEMEMFEYNTITRLWKRIMTTGNIKGRVWHQCNLIDDCIYLTKGQTVDNSLTSSHNFYGDVWRIKLELPITSSSIQNQIYIKKENFCDVIFLIL